MRINWITLTSPTRDSAGRLTSHIASIRYRVLVPAEQMPGYTHRVVPAPANMTIGQAVTAAENADVLVFSKTFNIGIEVTAGRAKELGAAVVFDICDNHFVNPDAGDLYRRMSRLADRVVCNTPAMAQIIKEETGVDALVIPDPYEGPQSAPRFAAGPVLKLLWFGHPANFASLQAALGELADYSTQQPLELTVLSQEEPQLVKLVERLQTELPSSLKLRFETWSLEAQAAALERCDVVIVPNLPTPQKSGRSANRVVQALRAGRPVVAQPVDSYLEFSPWTPVVPTLSEGLKQLEAQAAETPARIAQAQAHIEQNYSPKAIGEQWRAMMDGLKVNTPPPVRLNLGCGDKILEGYVNVDVVEARAGKKPDVLCDLHELKPFADNSVDEILSVHVVEHFWRWEVVDVLKEWVRVLKPGGKMILECPNLISACQALLANPEQASLPGQEGQRSMWVFYGDPRWQDPLMVHRWGYTPRSLAEVMHQAGLRDLRQEPAQFKLREPRDMRIVGMKPQSRDA